MNPNNPNNNANNDQDKTVVFSSSSSSANTSKPLDQTVVDNSPAGGAPKAAQPIPEPPKDASAGTQPPTNKPTTNKKGYSSGQMAAGVAGAGIAGAALGAAFSDDIQSAFQSSDATTEGEASGMGAAAAPVTDPATNTEASKIDIQTTDAEGNTYNVSMIDTDGDGQFDFTEGDAILVDGTSVHFEYHGDPLSALMSGEIAIAETADYQQMAEEGGFDCCYIHNEPFSYEIQSGDTLSEIAAANHTSVARLMELNPHITDPDVIYSGDSIQIPSNDNISNPYEGGVGLSDDSNNDVVEVSLEDLEEDSNHWVEEPVEVTNDIIETSSETETGEFVIEGIEDSETVLSGEEVDTASNPDDFSAIDWDSFEDNQASPDSYESELANANFDGYEMPDSYQDNAFYGGDADMANADFI